MEQWKIEAARRMFELANSILDKILSKEEYDYGARIEWHFLKF